MASEDIKPILNTPAGFRFGPVDLNKSKRILPVPGQQPVISDPDVIARPAPLPLPIPSATLGVLSKFTGTFAGTGFNTIFRPNNSGPHPDFTLGPVSGPPIPQVPNENILQLNLTTETLSFSPPLGNVPNRGLGGQPDIQLNGVPYVQVINDVTNTITGKADGKPTGIHFEPGLWMHVPASTIDPVVGATVVRMASIPHGTSINAQGLHPTVTKPGAPEFPIANITPFIIGGTGQIKFAAQDIDRLDTPRLPQDLRPFIAAGTITKEILENPNVVLEKANVGKVITSHIEMKVSTNSNVLGGGTANIAFLEGTGGGIQGNSSAPAANADAVTMESTFWISTVEHTIRIPIWKVGQGPLKLPPVNTTPIPHPIPGPIPGPIRPITTPPVITNPGPITTGPIVLPRPVRPATSSASAEDGDESGDVDAIATTEEEIPELPTSTMHTLESPPAAAAAAAAAAAPTADITSTANIVPEPAGLGISAVSTLADLPAPKFLIQPTKPILSPKTIKFTTTQIQYSQTVNLNFAGLTWPHVSVATLVPANPVVVPPSVWGENTI